MTLLEGEPKAVKRVDGRAVRGSWRIGATTETGGSGDESG